MSTNDPINPQHYRTGRIEVIEIIEDQKLNFNLGQVIKYVCRSDHKGDKLNDLKKARWYLDREILNLEKATIAPTWDNDNDSEGKKP